MHTTDLSNYSHDHGFGQHKRSPGERKTLIVALLTLVFMVVEVAAGIVYGSMALLADGLHMGSHAVALGIAVAAYIYARKRAGDPRFSFGTGKVNALGGFTGALLLAVFALGMAWESVERFIIPVEIVFNQAIAVAVLGLLVNGVSVLLLGVDHGHEHGHGHENGHGHKHGHGHEHKHGHGHEHEHGHGHEPKHEPKHEHEHGHKEGGHAGGPRHKHDHNLQSAYLHVLADALTSVLAIIALLAGKYFDLVWLDPAMGIVGAILVARWSWALLRKTGRVLLDYQASSEECSQLREALEAEGDDRVADLHVWSIGPGIRAACITIVSHDPLPAGAYRSRIPKRLGIQHATLEIHACPGLVASPAG